MVDFNFFEPYLDPPVKPNYSRMVWIGLYIGVLSGVALFQWQYQQQLTSIEENNQISRDFISSQPVIKRLSEIRNQEKAFQTLGNITSELSIFETLLNLKGQLQVGLFDEINQQVPEYVYVNAYNMTAGQVVISGYSDSYESIAQFQHQLRGMERFSEVFVPSVVEDQGNYVFTITATFKLEVPNENQ